MGAMASRPERAGTVRETPQTRSVSRALAALLIRLALVAGLAFLLLQFVLGVHVIHTNDMYPAVHDGDLCVTWRLGKAARGDIVAYQRDGEVRLGRVAALEGDVVDIPGNGAYTVNGQTPIEAVYDDTFPAPDGISYPCEVNAGELFLLNDLRDSDRDSRAFGAVPLSDVEGTLALLLRHRSW